MLLSFEARFYGLNLLLGIVRLLNCFLGLGCHGFHLLLICVSRMTICLYNNTRGITNFIILSGRVKIPKIIVLAVDFLQSYFVFRILLVELLLLC